MDECHLFKGNSDRANVITPEILQNSDVMILLSDTPQESRTAELFNSLSAISPHVFNEVMSKLETYRKILQSDKIQLETLTQSQSKELSSVNKFTLTQLDDNVG